MEFFQHHGTPRKPAKDLKGGPYRMSLEEATAVRDHWQERFPTPKGRRRTEAEYADIMAAVEEYRSTIGVAKRRAGGSRRRARKLTRFVEDVRIDVLGDAYEWTCALCGRPVDKTLRHPDPLSASHDHIVPLARGGEHSYSNSQLAHLVCNERKGAKL